MTCHGVVVLQSFAAELAIEKVVHKWVVGGCRGFRSSSEGFDPLGNDIQQCCLLTVGNYSCRHIKNTTAIEVHDIWAKCLLT